MVIIKDHAAEFNLLEPAKPKAKAFEAETFKAGAAETSESAAKTSKASRAKTFKALRAKAFKFKTAISFNDNATEADDK